MTAILDEWDRRGLSDIRWLAYMLATTFHETARTMQPIAEYGKGKGKKYGKPDPATGETYYGRGFVQLTWKDNYAKIGKLIGVDLVHDPDRALELAPASAAMFEGMIRGTFTGKKLATYFSASKDDPTNARRIINGTDCAAKIAGYHKSFLTALSSSLVRAAPVGLISIAAEPEPSVAAPEPVVVGAGMATASEPADDAPPAHPLPAGVKAARPAMPSIPADVAKTDAAIAAEIAAFNKAWDAAPTNADPDVFVFQTRLKWRQYPPGTIDGLWGSLLCGAISGFLNDFIPGASPIVPPTSAAEFASTLPSLNEQIRKAEAIGFRHPVSEARLNPTSAQLAEKAPEVVPAKRNFIATAWAAVVAFFTAVWNVVSGYVMDAWNFFTDHKDSLPDDSWTYLGKAHEYIAAVPIPVWLLLVASGLSFVAFNAWKSVRGIKSAFATGERL
jgi:hypothetical protein